MHGAPPEDTLRVFVSNGVEIKQVAAFGPEVSEFSQWLPNSIRLLDHIAITNSMQVSFRVADMDPDVNITEAAVDYVSVTNYSVLGVESHDEEKIKVFPNPFKDQLTVESSSYPINYQITDVQGKIVRQGRIDGSGVILDLGLLKEGLYLLMLNDQVIKVMKE